MAESDKIVNDAVDSRLNLPLPFGFLNRSAHTEKGHINNIIVIVKEIDLRVYRI